MKKQNSGIYYAFSLGRESKLSLAELIALFGEQSYINHSDEIALFSLTHTEGDVIAIFRNIGGSIRMMKILGETDEKKFPTDVIQEIRKSRHSEERRIQEDQPSKPLDASQAQHDGKGKITFALGVYGGEYRLSDIGLRIKKTLQESGVSARLVNTENQNIVSAVWKRDKLGRSKSEYNLIHIEGITYLAVTIACQDIDAYSKRDTGKSRDMIVGMMPPKLCQMMINLALPHPLAPSASEKGNLKTHSPSGEGRDEGVYDPFCGLGTILIEAANMGITTIYGSDLSSRMVESTQRNLEEFIKEERVWQERIKLAGGTPAKDFSDFTSEIFELDASKISKNTFPKNISLGSDISIVSEGYLGEIMHQGSISLDKVKQERSKLRNMYDGFFGGLCAMDFSGNIVMTFPFWDLHGTHSFFTEIYDVIGRHGFDIIPLLPSDMRTLLTPKGSLLYKRPNQSVGREVIKIRKR